MFDAWSGALKSFQSQTNNKIALLASDDPDGRGWYQAFAPEVAKLGMTAYKVRSIIRSGARRDHGF